MFNIICELNSAKCEKFYIVILVLVPCETVLVLLFEEHYAFLHVLSSM